MKKRIILLHSHIFKNAGSTIDEILKKNFINSTTFIESRDGQFISNEKIINTCLADKNIISLSSHKIRVPPPHHPDLHFIPLVMLRNPLDRLGSIYNFYRSQKSSFLQHECKLAQRLPFNDFVKVLVTSGNDDSFANLQTQFFLGQGVGLSEETWPMAVMNFKEGDCVGVVDKFDESIALWSKYLTQYFPSIDFSYQKMNASSNRAASIDARISVMEEALGEELLELFHQRNRYDYQLYGLASERVRRESPAIDNAYAATANFRRTNTTSFDENESKIDACQAEQAKSVTTNTDSETKTPLCFNIDGLQFLMPRIHRSNEARQQEAIIIGCGLFGTNNQPVNIVEQGQPVTVLIAANFSKNINQPIIGITVKDRFGTIIFAINTNYSSNKVEVILGKYTNIYSFHFIIPPLNHGSYSITPAIAMGTQDKHTVLDTTDDAVIFLIPEICNPRLPGILCLQNFIFSASFVPPPSI